jgi:ATP-dependent DNA ligase
VLSLPDLPAPSATDHLPEGASWRYEPDWDGLRVVVHRRAGCTALVSDRGKSMDRYFPEVVRHASRLPVDCTLRGSIVVVRPSGFSFERLRLRIHPSASRVAELTDRWPATLVLTDLLSRDVVDLRRCGLAERRSRLVTIAEDSDIPAASADLGQLASGMPAVVTPHTPFVSFATRWLEDRDESGRDGVIARETDGITSVRVPRLRTATCVVTGIRRHGSGPPRAMRLGLYDDGDAPVDVGRTTSLRGATERREAALALAGLEREAASSSKGWIDVAPEMVCEVMFERLRGQRFRSAARFVRWLPAMDPQRCTLQQLDAMAPPVLLPADHRGVIRLEV